MAPAHPTGLVLSKGRFLHSVNLSRTLGWGVFAPLLFFSFQTAEAPLAWYIYGAFMCFLYPALMTLLSRFGASRTRFAMVGLVLESSSLMLFTEIVGGDMVFLLLCSVIMVFNGGFILGWRGSLLILGTLGLTLFFVTGKLRYLPMIQLSSTLHYGMVLMLACYVAMVTNLTFSIVVRQTILKQRSIEQKRALENVHQHLLGTITSPFLSDQEILEQLSSQLSPIQLEKYRERIRTRQNFESIGRRTRSIGHDARNLLQPILTLSELLKEDLSENPDSLSMLEDLDNAANRLQTLLMEMDLPEKTQKTTDEICDLHSVMEEVVTLLRPSIPKEILIESRTNALSGRLMVPYNPMGLHRTLTNLCKNGLQALGEEGMLTLTTRMPSSEERTSVQASGTFVALDVADNGVGIDPRSLGKIFEPYFTTRKGHGGTGLGLSNAQAIVSEGGGRILVKSEVGKGTTFTLLLPTVHAADYLRELSQNSGDALPASEDSLDAVGVSSPLST